MDNELIKYGNFVNESSENFLSYLNSQLTDQSWKIIESIRMDTTIYIFSGVIRDFFLKRSEFRDIDIVVDKIKFRDIIHLLDKFQINRNAFGGYKLKFGNLVIDAWLLSNTWGIKEDQLQLTPESLISTAFFNFSAILYSLNEGKFYYNEHFLRFLRDKKIDVQYEKNPRIDLCIINSLYYKTKLNLSISPNLKKWIVQNYDSKHNYEPIQSHHFGKVVFSNLALEKFYLECVLDY